jgi:radical SAM superfamily enzyme YgiQ (UPF0313 family)
MRLLHLPQAHPRGSDARVLLSSVFGPYAQDDKYGSRAINPMELYHNQVTRAQGVFSLRMFHRSWGLMFIQANIEAPCNVLDFPTLERFEEELEARPYDIVGISAIPPNMKKVEHMSELIRRHQPQATVVVGGHIANVPDLETRLDVDHVVKGEGISWFRRFLGEDPTRPFRHPVIDSSIRTRSLGIEASQKPEDTAATIIPSVGCPLGCDFCSTSAMFGGKGKFFSFYEHGEQLYDVMARVEQKSGFRSFFIMDENFLLHRRRAMRLLDQMKANGKSWSLYVFSSASALRQYTMDELVALGVSWVWIGLEGSESGYQKLKGADTFALVRNLQSHGIRVLGSSIIGLPGHTAKTVEEAIEHAVAHDTEFHQFMLYTPVPGTPLWNKHIAEGNLLPEDEMPFEDAHGQYRFNYRHAHLAPGEETEALLRAFQRDFEVNGPSLARIIRTQLQGWIRLKDHWDERVRERIQRECADLPTVQAGVLWASEKWRETSDGMREKLKSLRKSLETEFGWKAKLAAPLVGRYLRIKMALEMRRLAKGRTYEPPTFYETNHPGWATGGQDAPLLAQWIEPGEFACEPEAAAAV